jgi:radical SAM/Cys-rich protein
MATINFAQLLLQSGINLSPTTIDTLQLNITKTCNQACTHCHVDSSPRRRESMSKELLQRCLHLLRESPGVTTVDITGGAPELHPEFKWFVAEVSTLGRKIIVRHNLTVTWDKHPVTSESMEYLPDFFKEYRIAVVSSLPYYQQYFTDRQRGDGVFEKSIKSLKVLNEKGYGHEGSHLSLDLVYNPVGPYLPGNQSELENDYRKELKNKFDVVFTNLFTITNMPINRFAAQLKKLGSFEEYMEKLHAAFNPLAAESVMCKSMMSVGHDGKVFDCDFNQMLGLGFKNGNEDLTLFQTNFEEFQRRQIIVGNHCFGCTAGSGSSCGGTTA